MDAVPSGTVTQGMCHFFYLSGMFKFHQRTKNSPKGFQPHVEGSCVLLTNGCSDEGMVRGDKPGHNANEWMDSRSSWTKFAGSSWLSVAEGCEVSRCSNAGPAAGSGCGKSREIKKQEEQQGQGGGRPRQGCPAFSAASSGL